MPVCGRAQTRQANIGEIAGMSDMWLRRLVMLAIVLLLLHAVGAWTYAVLGAAAAIVAAALVAAVSFFSGRMAGKGSDVWFVVPTVAFTAVPLAARVDAIFCRADMVDSRGGVRALPDRICRAGATAPGGVPRLGPATQPCGRKTQAFELSTDLASPQRRVWALSNLRLVDARSSGTRFPSRTAVDEGATVFTIGLSRGS